MAEVPTRIRDLIFKLLKILGTEGNLQIWCQDSEGFEYKPSPSVADRERDEVFGTTKPRRVIL